MTEIQKRFSELSQRAYTGGYTVYSDFCGLSELSELSSLNLSSPVSLWGGYDEAERTVICFGEREYFSDNKDYPIKCISIKPVNQKFADALSHRDFLGSLMGLGLRREVLGDIIINNNCGYVFCLDTIAPYIVGNLTQVRRTAVRCEITETLPETVLPKPENCEYIVSSERIDVIVASVCKISRSQALLLFHQDKVFVNGTVKENPSYTVKKGDLISVRGFGRIKYNGVLRSTKKERLVISVAINK